MFRRFSKNTEKEDTRAPFYTATADENSFVSPYKMGPGKEDSHKESTLRFDLPSPSILEEKSPLSSFQSDEPETTLGEGVVFRGELCFERCLRIDGTFEGELISKGKIIVGPKGKVKANLNLKEAIIEGRVEGNIIVEERVELRGDAEVFGDIQAKVLYADEGVTIVGHVQVMPGEKAKG